MPLWEIAYESFSLALEVTRGTAIAAPTDRMNMAGTITPVQEYYYPPDEVGTLAATQRSEIIRKSGVWEASGALDVMKLPVLANMCVAPVTTPTTPGGGTTARLWEFIRAMTSDNLKTATSFWGDPNVRILQGPFTILQEMTIASDASGTEGSTLSVSGISQHPLDIAAPAIPAAALGPLIIPGRMQVWIDVAGAIGTTAITGRVVSAEHTITSGVVPKYVATGPAGSVTYDHVGRERTSPETRIVMEVPDLVQFNNYRNGDNVKVRVRHNGPLIEATLYNFVEIDCYGKFAGFAWSELEGTNRTIEVMIRHEYNVTIASDLRLAIQNTRTAL